MKSVLASGTQKQKWPLHILIIWALLASVFLSFFAVSSASAATFTDDTTPNKLRAIKYWGALEYCASSFKTSISGEDIENGPRWWVSGGKTIDLGVYVDKWGDKNGFTACNGESDEEPGWISDVFKFFDMTVPSDRNARADFLETKLGYTCTTSGGTQTCKNDSAQKAASFNDSWMGNIRRLSPYLNGSAPSVGSYKDAYTYFVALRVIEASNGCKASEGGSSNLISVTYIASDGSSKTSDWSVKNDGGTGRANWSGIPVDAVADTRSVARGSGTQTIKDEKTCKELAQLTADHADAYKKFLAAVTCKENFPDGNGMFQEGCTLGASNATDYTICYSVSDATIGNNYRAPADQYRRGCFLGQGLPTAPDGRTSGEICHDMLYEGTELAACVKGSLNRGDSEYCNKEYPYYSTTGDYTDYNKAIRDACKEGQKIQGLTDTSLARPEDLDGATPGGGGDEQTSCAIPDVGWIMCPIINFMAGANDTLYGVLQGLLVVDTKIVEADSSNLAYNAWQVMRSFANVGFVIVFLIIIFSQISSIGISNYGIKKMLPRLVIAAILVNVSFIICQVAIDISNILGGSIVSLLDNTAVFGSTGNQDDAGTIAGGILAGTLVIGGTVAAGAATVGLAGGVLGAAALLLPVLLAALLAIVVTVFILATRKVVIILLVVLAPLAFLAMLLPNTENLFKQWRKILVSMLLVYPMIGLLFGGSTLAAKIIVGTGTDALQQIVGLIVLFVPLLLTPSLLQASLKAVPALGGFASKLASKANSNLSASANKRLKPLVDSALANRAANRTWLGKERVKRGIMGSKLDKDGNPIAGSRRLFGAKTEAMLGPDGKPMKDRQGNPITFAKKPKRQTLAAASSQASRRLEKNIEAGKAEAEANYGQAGLAGRTKMGRSIAGIADRSKTAGLDQERIDKMYTGRLKARQLTSNKEIGITAQLDDAETTIGVLDKKLGEEASLRIEHNEENTAAAAIGVADMQTELTVAHRDADGNVTGSSVETVDMKNLRDVSKVGFATEEATKASELRIQRGNKESGVASDSIQSQKESEAGTKVYDTQQDETFKTRQENEEPLMRLTEQQDAADRGIATLDAEQKARLEGVAKQSEVLEDLEKRKQTAEEQVATFHADEAAELAKRRAPGGDLAGLTEEQERSKLEEDKAKAEQDAALQRRKAPGGDLADLTAEEVRAKLDSENAQNAQKSAAEASKLPDGENADLFAESILGKVASDKTEAEKKRIESEARFGTNQQTPDGTLFSEKELADIVKTDQDTQASRAAGTWAEGGSQVQYADEIDSDSERGRELAVAASGADTRVKNRDGTAILEPAVDDEGNPIYEKNPDGSDKLDPAGNKVQAQRPKVAKLAQAKAAKVVLEDKESDQNTIVSLAKSRNMPNGEALANLGVNINTGGTTDDAGNPLPVPDLTPAEKLGYIRYAAGRGDKQTSMSLVSHVGRLGRAAKEARERATSPTATDDDRAEATRLTQEAKDAQLVLLEAGDSSLPPWLGGSDRQKLAEGTFEYDVEEAAIVAIASGKLTADAFSAMDINNRDQFVKTLETMPPDKIESLIQEVAEKSVRDAASVGHTLTRDDALEQARQNFAQAIVPIDKAQFDVRLNRGLAQRDKDRYDAMRKKLQEIANTNPTVGPRVPKIQKPDGTEEAYTGYNPSI